MSRVNPARRRRERGIALLIVLGTLALLTAVVAEFQFTSRVDLQLAANARDGLQAEYNALSALRMRVLLLKHARKLEGGIQGLAGAFGLDSNALPPIGQILEMIPVDCGLLSAITREADIGLPEDAGLSDEAPQEMFVGECTATSHSEHSKISVNVLGHVGSAPKVMPILVGMLMNPQLERHFEEDDRNGTHAETPEELVGAIADWVDRDKNQTGNQVADEDRHYEYLKDPYQAKNAPFDSLAELQLVHGVDDELYDLLADKLTIYADTTQIELATARDDNIFWGVLSCVAPGAYGPATVNAAVELLRLMNEMRMLAGGFAVMNVAMLKGLVGQAGLGGVIDQNCIGQRFTDKATNTWYTIEAEGRVGNATRRIRAVLQAQEGQFYYVRLE